MRCIRSIRLLTEKEGGFSLLEIAIVLAIIGLIGGVSFPLLKRHFDHRQLAVSQTRMIEIEEALAAYLLTFNHLPCPAEDPSGMAKRSCSDSEARGIVPYGTLGLNRETAKDGQGRFFTYAVHPELTTLTTDLKKGFCAIQRPAVRLIKHDGSGALSDDHVIAFLLHTHPRTPSQRPVEGSLSTYGTPDLIFRQEPPKNAGHSPITQEVIRFQTIRNFAGICLKISLNQMGQREGDFSIQPRGETQVREPQDTEEALFADDPTE